MNRSNYYESCRYALPEDIERATHTMGPYADYKKKVNRYAKYWSEQYDRTRGYIPLLTRRACYASKGYKHLDHKLSIRQGWLDGIDADIVGHWCNLRWVDPCRNLTKGNRSSVTSRVLQFMFWNRVSQTNAERHLKYCRTKIEGRFTRGTKKGRRYRQYVCRKCEQAGM